MINQPSNGLNACFISQSNHGYISDHINLSDHDNRQFFSFEELKLLQLKSFNPDTIIIDEYFKNKSYDSIIYAIKLNFKYTTIYFISPEYANYNSIIQSVNKNNHFYSNFSVDILKNMNKRSNDNLNSSKAS